jgi:RHS repeat-associated protein
MIRINSQDVPKHPLRRRPIAAFLQQHMRQELVQVNRLGMLRQQLFNDPSGFAEVLLGQVGAAAQEGGFDPALRMAVEPRQHLIDQLRPAAVDAELGQADQRGQEGGRLAQGQPPLLLGLPVPAFLAQPGAEVVPGLVPLEPGIDAREMVPLARRQEPLEGRDGGLAVAELMADQALLKQDLHVVGIVPAGLVAGGEGLPGLAELPLALDDLRIELADDGVGRLREGQAALQDYPLGNRTTTVYDSKGRVEATINPLGERTTTVYDAFNRVSATVDQLGGRTTIVYDAFGRQQNLIDSVNNKTTFVYDAASRLSEEIDPLGQGATFVYDALGRPSSTTDRLGRRRDFSYDAAGRPTGEVWIASDGSTVDNRITFTYDAAGNMLTARDFDGAYTLTYDALNRTATVQDVWGKQLTFTYDAVGNRTVAQDSLGGVTTTTYSALNQPVTRLFGGAGQTPMRIDQSYKADGQIGSIDRFTDLLGTTGVAKTSFTYDTAGRLANLHHREHDGDNIANYTYTYDNHSRLTQIERNGSFTTYTYDDTDQLTGDGVATFTYDANGNRNNGSYTVGTGNRLTSDGTWTYTYDDEGNLTKKTKGALQETWTYGYDQRNQLTTVEKRATDGGTLQLNDEFKYDAFGNRIEKKIDSDGNGSWDTTQRYALDGWKNVRQPLVGNENWDVWADLDGSSSLTTRYVRGDVIDQLFARIEEDPEGDIPYWYLTDHLGSIRDVIDGSAVVKDSITYDGFGNINAETDSNYRGRYAWTGREIDSEIELQYNRARYYDVSTARWTSQDPLGFDAGDSNLYRYVKNRLLAEVDPSGLTGMIEIGSPVYFSMIIGQVQPPKKQKLPSPEELGFPLEKPTSPIGATVGGFGLFIPFPPAKPNLQYFHPNPYPYAGVVVADGKGGLKPQIGKGFYQVHSKALWKELLAIAEKHENSHIQDMQSLVPHHLAGQDANGNNLPAGLIVGFAKPYLLYQSEIKAYEETLKLLNNLWLAQKDAKLKEYVNKMKLEYRQLLEYYQAKLRAEPRR